MGILNGVKYNLIIIEDVISAIKILIEFLSTFFSKFSNLSFNLIFA